MTTKSITSLTEGQKKQYRRFVEDGADRALTETNLDKDGLQKLLEQGDEFQAYLVEGIRRLLVANEFADEEVESSYGYLSGYKPKGITEQTNLLRQLFTIIGFANEKLAEQPLPTGAEGYFAIPRWETLAKSYPEAIQKVLDMISQTRNGKFYNYRQGQIDTQHIRQLAKTAKMLKRLGEEQEGYDILVVPCQFGLRHRGKSVRHAHEVMDSQEFGLGAFAVGMMLLTHENRLKHYDDLWVDCAGDEFSAFGDGHFDRAPCFNFCDGVKFGSNDVSDPHHGFGSVSAFVPQ